MFYNGEVTAFSRRRFEILRLFMPDNSPASNPVAANTITYVPLKYALMGAFLLIILPVLGGLSWLNHRDSSREMEASQQLLRQQSEAQILQIIRLMEASHRVLNRLIDKEMEALQADFVAAYQQANGIENLDLTTLKNHFHDSFEWYIINSHGIVEYATYAPDLGADLSVSLDFAPVFAEVLKQRRFVSGGLVTEGWSGKLRKYAFFPAPEQDYVLGFSADVEVFGKLLGNLNLLKLTQQLKSINPSLINVRIFTAQGYVLGDPNYQASATVRHIVDQVYRSSESVEVIEEKAYRLTRYVFAESDAYDEGQPARAWVLELSFSTWEIRYVLEQKANVHFIVSSVAVIISIALTFILAAWITRPINQIVRSVNIIAQGNLDHPIDTTVARNELRVLKHSIMLMARNMSAYIQQIEQHNRELQDIDRLKDDFLSNTSHELRTPLHGIIGLADSMLNGACGELPTKARENLTMISMSGRRLTNLINDILDFSKLKHNNLNLQLKSVEIYVLVDIVLALLKPLVGSKRLSLQNRVARDLVPAKADETRLQQIFYNLIGNAIKFTEAGVVEISARQDGEQIIIAVADTGVGIPPQKLANVFNSFEQVDSSSAREYGGTGLGLSITKRLVELHGGTISLESAPGQGTIVYFSLPTADASLIRADAPNQTETRQICPDAQNKNDGILPHEVKPSGYLNERDSPHILIVDDEYINLQVLENLLLVENYSVTRAYNGVQALQILREGREFALILLDVMMPKMSGFEVCRIIRKTHPATELPVIMLTAKNQISDLVAGLESGANDYLSKPFSQSELSARMRTHIQLARISMAYSHFVPHEFLNLLEKKSIVDVRLGDHVQRDMTVLFMDIRAFTSISEKMTPQENFAFINEYLSCLSPVIRKHNGFIDKYIGDAIMALFPRAPKDALQAVLEMSVELQHFNDKRQHAGNDPVRIGVGLHYGTLMLGTIGESKRMEGTVIADAVNLSSRLEGLTKLYGASVIVSEQVLQSLDLTDIYQVRLLGKVRVRGKQQPVKIFELLDASLDQDNDNQKLTIKDTFNHAMEFYYRKQFAKAAEKFRQVLSILPNDKVSRFYLERSLYYSFQRVRLPPDWDGVEELSEK
jgi:two-component system, sensor histidine kinase ChiS